MYNFWLLNYSFEQQRENGVAVCMSMMSADQKYCIFAWLINHVEVLGGGNRLLQKVIFRSCVDNELGSEVPRT